MTCESCRACCRRYDVQMDPAVEREAAQRNVLALESARVEIPGHQRVNVGDVHEVCTAVVFAHPLAEGVHGALVVDLRPTVARCRKPW